MRLPRGVPAATWESRDGGRARPLPGIRNPENRSDFPRITLARVVAAGDNPWMRVWVVWVLVSLLGCGCGEKGQCERICRRLAECRLEARQGAPILGEQKPPAEPECLSRCAQGSERFAACEGKHRDCEHLLACSGALR